MNHKSTYKKLMKKARSENRVKGNKVYYERHHIVPKCIGGSNKKDNLVLLTAREHYIAHHLLYMMYRGTKYASSMAFAFWSMVSNKRNKKRNFTARQYETARKAASKSSKKMWKNKRYKKIKSNSAKKQWKNKEHRIAMRKSAKKQWKNKEHRIAMRKSAKKQWKNKEHRIAMGKFHKKMWENKDLKKGASKHAKKLWKNEKFRRTHTIDNPQSKKTTVIDVKTNETIGTFYSITEASRQLKLARTSVLDSAKAGRPFRGYKFIISS